MKSSTFYDRFWKKVDRTPGLGPQGDCWEFRSLDVHCYGQINEGHRVGNRMLKAHRISWEIANGREVPSGSCVLHSCDNPACVNPEHLCLGTRADNNRDMYRKGRSAAQKGTQALPCGDDHWSRRNPEDVSRGEENGNAKLTEAGVRTIREGAAGGITQRELARRFGVTQAAISSIVRRRNWSRVG